MQELENILEEVEAEHPYKVPGNYDSYSQYNEAWQGAIDRVRARLENFFKEKENGGWVPVGERFPEEAGTYIVNALNGERSIVTFAKWKNRYKRFDMTGARAYWRVNAWRPLPEPYRTERSNDEKE